MEDHALPQQVSRPLGTRRWLPGLRGGTASLLASATPPRASQPLRSARRQCRPMLAALHMYTRLHMRAFTHILPDEAKRGRGGSRGEATWWAIRACGSAVGGFHHWFCYNLMVKMIFTAKKLPDCHRQFSIRAAGQNLRFYYELAVQILLAKAIFLVDHDFM